MSIPMETKTAESVQTFPISESPKIVGRVGYQDGHVEFEVSVWVLGSSTFKVSPNSIPMAKAFIDAACSWLEKIRAKTS